MAAPTLQYPHEIWEFSEKRQTEIVVCRASGEGNV